MKKKRHKQRKKTVPSKCLDNSQRKMDSEN